MAKKIKIKAKKPQNQKEFDIAVQHFQSGNLQQAEIICRRILELQPGKADAWHLLGIIAGSTGRYGEAANCLRQALDIKPSEHRYYYDLGLIFQNAGAPDRAIENYNEALRLKPDYLEAHYNRGNLFAGSGMNDEAIGSYKNVIRINPAFPDVYHNIGNSFLACGKVDEAVESYQKALRLKPGIAAVHGNLGLAFEEKGMLDEAVESYREALLLKPAAETFNNLGGALKNKGALDEAIKSYIKALELRPDDPKIHANLGMTYLLSKDFERGWEEYEWTLKYTKVPPLRKPLQAGKHLNGRKVLVYSVHGFGDNIQLVRFLPKITEALGAEKVLFIPQKGLELLFREAGLNAEIIKPSSQAEDLEFDADIHLLSLPRIFKTDLENMPFRRQRYLKANEEKVKWYREKYFLENPPLPPFAKVGDSGFPPLKKGDEGGFSGDKLKIGIFWQGNPGLKPDKNRSMPLSHFYPLCRLPGIKVYSLQKGHGMEQLNDLPEDINIVNLGETFNDFSDTAAAIENLDLMITVDTAIGHLSGALGKKTWILLPSHAEWRWHLDLDYSPWYEDVKLFRHKELGKKDWEEMMERILKEVLEVTNKNRQE